MKEMSKKVSAFNDKYRQLAKDLPTWQFRNKIVNGEKKWLTVAVYSRTKVREPSRVTTILPLQQQISMTMHFSA